MNAAIFARHRDRPLAEVPEAARASHRATRRPAAPRLADRAVAGTVADVVPPGAEHDGFSTVSASRSCAAWIAGNTWEHWRRRTAVRIRGALVDRP